MCGAFLRATAAGAHARPVPPAADLRVCTPCVCGSRLAPFRCDCSGVQLATIFFGANDAARPDASSGKQNIPLEEYKANLRAIVAHARAAGIASILLITPPPVHAEGRVEYQKLRIRQNGGNPDQQQVVPDRTNDFTGTYARACCSVAEELNVPCLDLWTQMQASGAGAGAACTAYVCFGTWPCHSAQRSPPLPGASVPCLCCASAGGQRRLGAGLPERRPALHPRGRAAGGQVGAAGNSAVHAAHAPRGAQAAISTLERY